MRLLFDNEESKRFFSNSTQLQAHQLQCEQWGQQRIGDTVMLKASATPGRPGDVSGEEGFL